MSRAGCSRPAIGSSIPVANTLVSATIPYEIARNGCRNWIFYKNNHLKWRTLVIPSNPHLLAYSIFLTLVQFPIVDSNVAPMSLRNPTWFTFFLQKKTQK
eukprot:gene26082-biopygen13682